MIFHFFVSFLFDSFFVHTSCDCTKYFFFFLQNEGLNQCWFWFSEFLIVVAYWNMNVWGVDFFLISRKNCKIIFHWFHFSRITFFLEKRKTNYTYISSYHASKFLGVAPKINLWDWLLIKYFNLQDAYTLSVILNNIFTQKIKKGAWHQTSLWGRGGQKENTHTFV